MTAEAPANPPFRAEHIGSLVRPDALLAARKDFEAGRIDGATLRAAEDRAIRDVVALQEEAGLRVVTDGEFRRGTYSDSFTTQGIRGVSMQLTEEGGFRSSESHGHRMARRIPRVVERIQWAGPNNAKDFAFLKSVTKRTGKITLPGPGYIHYRAGRQNISAEVYPKLDDFWSDLVGAYHQELASLREAGCTYVQIDETSLVKLGEERVRKLLAGRGDDWQQLLRVYIDAINAIVAKTPQGMTIGVHVCRSQDPNWQSDIGYEPIADALFGRMNVTTYFLEYDNPRAGGFEPLARVPEGKRVVLGIVASHNPELESVAFIRQRIAEAAKYLPLERLALSPQCGFSTGLVGAKMSSEEIERKKLARVVEAAREVWGE
jgi:5-methyltetrahydropteroyltriglutamate--homocysteine methyltransferase